MRHAALVVVLLASTLLVLGCTDEPEPAAPDAAPSFGTTPTAGMVRSQIAQLFPPGSKQEAFGLFNEARRLLRSGQTTEGQNKILEVVKLTLNEQKADNLRDPNRSKPPTINEAVIQLIKDLFLFGGMGESSIGPQHLTDFGVAEVVTPAAVDVAPKIPFTAMRFFDNSVLNNVLVLEEPIPQVTARACPFGFTTPFDCFGPTADWKIEPSNSPFEFNVPPLLAVCQVTDDQSPLFHEPFVSSNRLQLAHGLTELIIEAREETPANLVVDCDAANQLVGGGGGGGMAFNGLNVLYQPVAWLAERLLAPPSLHAAAAAVSHPRGVSARPKSFAGDPFVAIDPGEIAGNVCVPDEGCIGIEGAELTLSGAASADATTDENGDYSFPGLNVGTYTVTLTDPGEEGEGFVFEAETEDCTPGDPSAECVINASGVLTVDFVGASAALPDLTVESITVRPSPSLEESLTFTDLVRYDVVVRNGGTATAPATTMLLAGPSGFTSAGSVILQVPELTAGASTVKSVIFGPRFAGTTTVTATVDQSNTIVESDETNNSFTAPFTVEPRIHFESLGDGTPVTLLQFIPFQLTIQYLLQGVEFTFVKFDETASTASLCNSSLVDPAGVTTNHSATIHAVGDPCSGFLQGTLTMTFSATPSLPTTVRMQLRGNNIIAFPLAAFDAAGNPLTVTRSGVVTYTSNGGFTARQEIAEVVAGGIARVVMDLPAGTGVVFIDDLVIVR